MIRQVHGNVLWELSTGPPNSAGRCWGKEAIPRRGTHMKEDKESRASMPEELKGLISWEKKLVFYLEGKEHAVTLAIYKEYAIAV